MNTTTDTPRKDRKITVMSSSKHARRDIGLQGGTHTTEIVPPSRSFSYTY